MCASELRALQRGARHNRAHLPSVLCAISPVHQVLQRLRVLALATATLGQDGPRLKLLEQLLFQLLRVAQPRREMGS